LSHDANQTDLFRRAASEVKGIRRGWKPLVLPVQNPVKRAGAKASEILQEKVGSQFLSLRHAKSLLYNNFFSRGESQQNPW
jgi:hypothetical protein